ncbi:TadE/TadG family type IV pilus assembly protein [Magnetospirillum aberrantis]|uniref:Pilus assembly protein n=1 Tax=Magnetospirillum aberrantis SpK TaxID=908842 RepID=A0A7C9UXA1_9PROT|nr:TadE family protein [Magnetospirillum aberrantis]NFV80732.1 pilus assembly protein [Magnetospirillum aberrantis SpK]
MRRGGGIGGWIWRNRGASVALEFALIAPVIILLLFGTIEAGLMLLTDANLELAVRNGTRYGITGAGGATRDKLIKEKITDLMERWKGPEGVLTVEFKAYPSFDNIGQPEPFTDGNDNGTYDAGEGYEDINGNKQWDSDMASADGGGAGDIVIYTVTLTRPSFTKVLALAGIDTLVFRRQTVVENE